MIPTEHEGTVAVDAAARALFKSHAPHVEVTFDDLIELEPLEANRYRERVLPLVWAALEALPDRPRFPAGLFVDPDADDEPCVWQIDPEQGGGPYLVARRCDVTPTAWAILDAAAVPA